MCGRYSFTQTPKSDQVVLAPNQEGVLRPRYNMAPTQLGPIISQRAPEYFQLYRWGLIPHWAKDLKIGYKLINARAETLLEKASFKHAARHSRCLVWADGFYEWKKVSAGKQPYRIVLSAEDPFYFAGLTARWQAPDATEVFSYTIITTEPNEIVAEIHDRMPVILSSEAARRWISQDESIEELLPLLRPYPGELMTAYPVSKLVGNVRNDHPDLAKPLEDQGTLPLF